MTWVARILESTTAPLDSDTVSIHARRQSVTLWRVRDGWFDRFLPSSQLCFKATGLRHADSLCCIRKPSCVNVWNFVHLVFRLSNRQTITKLVSTLRFQSAQLRELVWTLMHN